MSTASSANLIAGQKYLAIASRALQRPFLIHDPCEEISLTDTGIGRIGFEAPDSGFRYEGANLPRHICAPARLERQGIATGLLAGIGASASADHGCIAHSLLLINFANSRSKISTGTDRIGPVRSPACGTHDRARGGQDASESMRRMNDVRRGHRPAHRYAGHRDLLPKVKAFQILMPKNSRPPNPVCDSQRTSSSGVQGSLAGRCPASCSTLRATRKQSSACGTPQ